MNEKKNKVIEELLELEKDVEGRNIIEMTVLDDSNFLSPYCGKQKVISNEVADYLEKSILNTLPTDEIALHITSNCITLEEFEIYKKAIVTYYQREKKDTLRDAVKNKWISLIMFICGITIIALMFLLDHYKVGEIWITILEIIGWVFIWEATDKFIFERRKLDVELRRWNKLIHAKITLN